MLRMGLCLFAPYMVTILLGNMCVFLFMCIVRVHRDNTLQTVGMYASKVVCRYVDVQTVCNVHLGTQCLHMQIMLIIGKIDRSYVLKDTFTVN